MKRISWCLAIGGVTVAALAALPAWAQSAVLTARQPGSQIVVRSQPSTTAASPGYGLPGDRVDILEDRVGSDGLLWYLVRFDASGEVGWIRSDFVSLQAQSSPAPQPPSRANSAEDYYAQGYQRGEQDIRAGRPYAPETVARRLPENLAESYTRGYGDGYISATGSTLLGFETNAYAVRLYRVGEQLQMNVFDKRLRRPELTGSPAVQVVSSSSNPTYVNTEGGLRYFVTQVGDQYQLTINENGSVIYQEQSR